MSERSEQELLAGLDRERLPQHIAVIMDGNGRWARERGSPRIEGHRASMQSIREAVTACNDIGIKYLTLYAFSTENWSRPPDEVAALMVLIEYSVRAQTPELHEKRVRVRHLGRRDGLPEPVLRTLDESAELTAANPGLTLQLAINYGGRQEIADAARAAAREVLAGTLGVEQVTEEALSRRLYRPDAPDPDLLIRTGGDLRVSNYLLWEIAYAEIYVTPVLWPDFARVTYTWRSRSSSAAREDSVEWMMSRSYLVKLAISLPVLVVLIFLNEIAKLNGLPSLLIGLGVAFLICEPFRVRLTKKAKGSVATLPLMGAALVLLLAYCWRRDLSQAILLLITIGVVFDILLVALAAIGEVTKRGFRGLVEFLVLVAAGLVLGAAIAFPLLLFGRLGNPGP